MVFLHVMLLGLGLGLGRRRDGRVAGPDAQRGDWRLAPLACRERRRCGRGRDDDGRVGKRFGRRCWVGDEVYADGGCRGVGCVVVGEGVGVWASGGVGVFGVVAVDGVGGGDAEMSCFEVEGAGAVAAPAPAMGASTVAFGVVVAFLEGIVGN